MNILTFEQWIEKRCFDEDLEHNIAQEGLLIEISSIIDEVEKYTKYCINEYKEQIFCELENLSFFGEDMKRNDMSLSQIKQYLEINKLI